MYASLFGISGALHLNVFEHPEQQMFLSNLLENKAHTHGDENQTVRTAPLFQMPHRRPTKHKHASHRFVASLNGLHVTA
jgi:hypothetical protein